MTYRQSQTVAPSESENFEDFEEFDERVLQSLLPCDDTS